MAVDPPKILAQGVEVDDGVSGTVESHLLDERAVQRLEAQVDGTLPGGRKLVDRAGKVAPYVTGLVQDGLRCIAAPERAGGKGKAVQKTVGARVAADPDHVASGGAREASSGIAVTGHKFLQLVGRNPDAVPLQVSAGPPVVDGPRGHVPRLV